MRICLLTHDDYRTGCQSLSIEIVNSPIQDYIHFDDHTQPTYKKVSVVHINGCPY